MQFGSFELFIAWDGYFRLDGGAMFGVVPKILWSRTDPADDRNRILLSINPLVVKTGNSVFLIDTGIGSEWDDKSRDIFGIDRKSTVTSSLEHKGIGKEDITGVIFTHLHFDHSGGAVERNENGLFQPAFPNAVYYIQRGEWECAVKPNERTKASYPPENFLPLKKANAVHFLDGDGDIAPGISVLVTGGHTPYHQVVLLRSEGNIACYCGDLIPTSSHLHLPNIMGYDTNPLDTLEAKRRLITQAINEHWLVIFAHSPRMKAGYLVERAKKVELEPMELT